MKTRPVIITAAIVAAVAGCGTAATATRAPTTPAASTPAASTAPAVISPGDEGRACAALNALENPLTGSGKPGDPTAWQTVEQAFSITPAQLAKAVHDRCQRL